MLNFPHMDEDHIRSTGGNDHMMNSSDHEIPVTDIMSDGAHTPVVAWPLASICKYEGIMHNADSWIW